MSKRAKINDASHVESIEVYLSEDKTPIAYANKLAELMDDGMEESDARKFINDYPIELELIYHHNNGLFAVESEVVEYAPIYSPYDGTECEYEDAIEPIEFTIAE